MSHEDGESPGAETTPALIGCEICDALAAVETSFYKWGWDEQDRPLPRAAARLQPIGDISSYDAERHHLKRCPLCGTYYRYDVSYEYLVNGSEEEEVLRRLTPAEAQECFGADSEEFRKAEEEPAP